MTVNPLRGEVAITVDGRERILRPTFDAIVKWEAEIGLPTFQIAKSFEGRNILLDPISKVILSASTDGLTKDELGAEIERRGFLWLFDPAFLLLVNALNGGATSAAHPAEGASAGEAQAADQTVTM